MNRTTYSPDAEHVETPLTGPSGPTQTGPVVAGASILRRPLRLTLQTVTVAVDQNGETVDAAVDIGVWADSIVSQSPPNTNTNIERKQS